MMKRDMIVVIFIFIVISLLLIFIPNINQDYVMQGKLYISKIMAINSTVHKDNHGEYSDYIELYNGYNYDINLDGYYLSDSEFDYDKWMIPNIVIKAKSSLIIYASGNDYCDLVKSVCHTNFKLSGQGEVVLLSDKFGNIISKISYPVQYPDMLYGYIDGKYQYIDTNGKVVKIKNVNASNYKIKITEYMTHNKNSYYDKYGNYYDFVEIYNDSDKDYTIDGLYISDDISNLKKYALPDKIIKKNSYMIINFTSNNFSYDDGIYVNFGLSDDDEWIIISDGNKIIDKVQVFKLVDDVSYGIMDNKWYYFTKPTPGAVNDTYGVSVWGDK